MVQGNGITMNQVDTSADFIFYGVYYATTYNFCVGKYKEIGYVDDLVPFEKNQATPVSLRLTSKAIMLVIGSW